MLECMCFMSGMQSRYLIDAMVYIVSRCLQAVCVLDPRMHACMQMERLYVVKLGEVSLSDAAGNAVEDPSFVKEAAGFSYFGEAALTDAPCAPYTITVKSESLHMLTLTKR